MPERMEHHEASNPVHVRQLRTRARVPDPKRSSHAVEKPRRRAERVGALPCRKRVGVERARIPPRSRRTALGCGRIAVRRARAGVASKRIAIRSLRIATRRKRIPFVPRAIPLRRPLSFARRRPDVPRPLRPAASRLTPRRSARASATQEPRRLVLVRGRRRLPHAAFAIPRRKAAASTLAISAHASCSRSAAATPAASHRALLGASELDQDPPRSLPPSLPPRKTRPPPTAHPSPHARLDCHLPTAPPGSLLLRKLRRAHTARRGRGRRPVSPHAREADDR